jgi:hypothetical protein
MPAYDPPVNAFYTEVSLPVHVNPEKFIGREVRGVSEAWPQHPSADAL